MSESSDEGKQMTNMRKRERPTPKDDDKKEERLAANRKAARESRRRKKILIEELQSSVSKLEKENDALRRENDQLNEKWRKSVKMDASAAARMLSAANSTESASSSEAGSSTATSKGPSSSLTKSESSAVGSLLGISDSINTLAGTGASGGTSSAGTALNSDSHDALKNNLPSSLSVLGAVGGAPSALLATAVSPQTYDNALLAALKPQQMGSLVSMQHSLAASTGPAGALLPGGGAAVALGVGQGGSGSTNPAASSMAQQLSSTAANTNSLLSLVGALSTQEAVLRLHSAEEQFLAHQQQQVALAAIRDQYINAGRTAATLPSLIDRNLLSGSIGLQSAIAAGGADRSTLEATSLQSEAAAPPATPSASSASPVRRSTTDDPQPDIKNAKSA